MGDFSLLFLHKTKIVLINLKIYKMKKLVVIFTFLAFVIANAISFQVRNSSKITLNSLFEVLEANANTEQGQAWDCWDK